MSFKGYLRWRNVRGDRRNFSTQLWTSSRIELLETHIPSHQLDQVCSVMRRIPEYSITIRTMKAIDCSSPTVLPRRWFVESILVVWLQGASPGIILIFWRAIDGIVEEECPIWISLLHKPCSDFRTQAVSINIKDAHLWIHRRSQKGSKHYGRTHHMVSGVDTQDDMMPTRERLVYLETSSSLPNSWATWRIPKSSNAYYIFDIRLIQVIQSLTGLTSNVRLPSRVCRPVLDTSRMANGT